MGAEAAAANRAEATSRCAGGPGGPAARVPPDAAAGPGLTGRRWWPLAKRVLTVALILGVLALVVDHARSVDWPAVWVALRATPARVLLLGGALASACYLLFSCYDLIGRHQAGHRIPTARVAAVGFVCYAFNLNLGSLVGAVALRYRLYSRLGLASATITEIILLSLMTNWLGYLVLAGLAFTLAPLGLPASWEIGSQGLRWVGGGLLLVAAGYLAMCFFASQRVWQVRQTRIHLPAGRVALLQLLLSTLNWGMNAAIVWVLLQQRVAYPVVLSVLLLAAVAGIVTHVPAGLGVLEGVFIALLGTQVAQPALIGALLAYRALYYLAPLAVGALVWLAIDVRAKPEAHVAGDAPGAPLSRAPEPAATASPPALPAR